MYQGTVLSRDYVSRDYVSRDYVSRDYVSRDCYFFNGLYNRPIIRKF
jgi:hypothetical protein